MRVHIGIYGNRYRRTVKNVTKKEFEFLKNAANVTGNELPTMVVEQIPEKQKLINKFKAFMKNPRYSDWKKDEVIHEFVRVNYIHKTNRVMDFLFQEIKDEINPLNIGYLTSLTGDYDLK